MENKSRYNKSENYVEPFPGITHDKLSKEELKECIKKAKMGDERAFEIILGHMHNYLCFLTKEFFIQGSEAQDVYQEGVIKLINVIQKYDSSKGSFVSFAQSSIRKHIITSINKEQAKKRCILNNSFSINDESKNQNGDVVTFLDSIPEEDQKHKGAGPLDVVQKDYEDYLLQKIAEVLSDMEQKVFVLRYFEQMSYRDIAKELGLKKRDNYGKLVWDQKSVDNAIWRSRPKIKKVLEKLNLNSSSFEKRMNSVKRKDKKAKEKKNAKSDRIKKTSKKRRNV